MTELKNFVGGKYADTREGRTSDVVDPSTGEAYAQAPVSSAEDVDAALNTAADAFATWRDATPAERGLALLKIADAVEARAGDLVAAECRNTGPHRRQGRAGFHSSRSGSCAPALAATWECRGPGLCRRALKGLSGWRAARRVRGW